MSGPVPRNPDDRFTWRDYQAWPDEERWEIIDGVAYAMSPAPSVAHQAVSNMIARLLDAALDDCPQCHALLPVDWRISEPLQ